MKKETKSINVAFMKEV